MYANYVKLALRNMAKNRLYAFINVVGLAIGLAVFHLYVAAFGTPEGRSFRTVHLSAMLVLAICMFPLFRRSAWQPISQGSSGDTMRWIGFAVDLILIAYIIFVQIWTIYDINAFHMRYGEKETPDIIVGGLFILLVLEVVVTHRTRSPGRGKRQTPPRR